MTLLDEKRIQKESLLSKEENQIIKMIDQSYGHIALDIGNVIVRWDPQVFIDAMVANICFIAEHPVRFIPDPGEWLEKVQPMQDLGISTIGHMLDLEFGRKVSPPILRTVESSWNHTIKFVPEMVERIEKWLETRKIALLSNMGKQHLKFLRESLPQIFNHRNTIQHISCEVGVRKPSKLFYQSFLWENPEFKGAVYLDDLQENVVAGDRAGLQSYCFHIDSL